MGPSPPDGDLVLRLRRGDPRAFDEAYGLYREPIWRFLHRLSGSREAAEDLFQDTWLAAARHAHRLREDTQLLSWLYTIARNKHRNALRSHTAVRRATEVRDPEPDADRPSPEDQVDAAMRARILASAWARLPDAHREVLALAIDGLPTNEIARILDLREVAARKRLSRARAELARIYDAYLTGGSQP